MNIRGILIDRGRVPDAEVLALIKKLDPEIRWASGHKVNARYTAKLQGLLHISKDGVLYHCADKKTSFHQQTPVYKLKPTTSYELVKDIPDVIVVDGVRYRREIEGDS